MAKIPSPSKVQSALKSLVLTLILLVVVFYLLPA